MPAQSGPLAPPEASLIAVPPSASTLRSVALADDPPLTSTSPQESPTVMALPALSPDSTSPIATAPPFAAVVAVPRYRPP
jgi:hypothetical protein